MHRDPSRTSAEPCRCHPKTLGTALQPYLAALVATVALSWTAPAAASSADDVEALMDQGKELLEQGETGPAIRRFRQATKQDPSCGPCHLALSRAYQRLGAHKKARESAEMVLDLATDRYLRASAHNALGVAISSGADGDRAQLETAEAHFREALEGADGMAPAILFNLGDVLLRLERDLEGKAMLEAFLETDPGGPMASKAEALIAQPELARRPMLPFFEAATLDGDYFDSQELRGRVVLIDFWATWCPPCVAAIPSLRRWSRKYEDRPFLLVGLNVDSQREIAERFIAEEKISWPQIWDQGSKLSGEIFGVRSYPTYFLVDHTGEIVYRSSGGGPSIERALAAKIRSAVRVAEKAADRGDGG